jgi:hypothetical protein
VKRKKKSHCENGEDAVAEMLKCLRAEVSKSRKRKRLMIRIQLIPDLVWLCE